MNTFHLRILEADKEFFNGDCISLVFPYPDGYYGVQANHKNMVCAIDEGIANFTLPNGEKRYASISDGIIKIEKNDVLILVNTAERPEDIDENRAKREEEDAKEQMLQSKDPLAFREAKEKIQRERNRLKLLKYKK